MLPILYFDNIARYVRDGGALLVAAGPDTPATTSLCRTPLDRRAAGRADAAESSRSRSTRVSPTSANAIRSRAASTARHRATALEPLVPHRRYDAQPARKPMDDRRGRKPLLLLVAQGEGRVALLLSDQIWLWARGYEGGGPHLDLLRRLSHWLMKEPELEEEALRLKVKGKDLLVQRQTMADTVTPVTVTSPSGAMGESPSPPASPDCGALRPTPMSLACGRRPTAS